MARKLTFKFKSEEFTASPVKIDRSKLYGWTALKALDDNGKDCKLVNMDENGSIIIPKGGLGLGILSPEKEWIDRSNLKAINPDGSNAEQILSSYNAPIELINTVDEETFLDHKITAVYQLAATEDFISAVGNDIYNFTYSFRDSFKGEAAFIMATANSLFMLLGQKTEFEMLNLTQAESIDDDNSEDEDEDSDDLDFSIM